MAKIRSSVHGMQAENSEVLPGELLLPASVAMAVSAPGNTKKEGTFMVNETDDWEAPMETFLLAINKKPSPYPEASHVPA